MKLQWMVILGALTLGGCAAMQKMGGSGVLEVYEDQFNGGTRVTMTSAPTVNLEGINATTELGGYWSAQSPDVVLLRLVSRSSVDESDTYVTFEQLKVNIDGEITNFDAGTTSHDSGGYNEISRTIYTLSKSSVVMPYDYFVEMIENPNTKVRVTTRRFYEDIDFQKETNYGGFRLAKATLKEFKTEIDKHK